MKLLIAIAVGGLLVCGGCGAEKTVEAPPAGTTVGTTDTAPPVAVVTAAPVPAAPPAATRPPNENDDTGTWAGQVKVGHPVSMFNYVGAESGDFAPMRFTTDSEIGRKILAGCADDELCELTGVVEWLDEVPPPDASAIGQIIRVDSVKRLPPAQR